jgi:5-methylcytosine-specific restriction endonuclease McrA
MFREAAPDAYSATITADPYKSSVYQRNRRLVLEASGWRCSRCGGVATTADHVLALARGGSHDLANLRALCARCNSQLGAQITNELKARRKVGRQSRRW